MPRLPPGHAEAHHEAVATALCGGNLVAVCIQREVVKADLATNFDAAAWYEGGTGPAQGATEKGQGAGRQAEILGADNGSDAVLAEQIADLEAFIDVAAGAAEFDGGKWPPRGLRRRCRLEPGQDNPEPVGIALLDRT